MKFNLKILILSLIVQSSICYSQTICTDGFAGIYPCHDYDLMSNISILTLTGEENAEGSDVWGWTDPLDDKEYAIIATSHSTAFVDVTIPTNPVFLGRLDTEAGVNLWRDVKVYNNYAFIVADNVGPHGMQVFDLTRLRSVASPPEIFTADTVYNDVGSCHNIVINESEGMAYLVGCNTASGGPVFVDISNPLSPTSAGSYPDDNYTHDAQVITYNGPDLEPDAETTSIPTYVGREILVASNGSFGADDKLIILDVTNKNDVIKIAEISYSQPGYAHQGWFTDDHRYFIMGDETDEQAFGMNSRTLVFDLLDLDNPVLTTTYLGASGAIDHNGYVKGNKFYLANYRAGMRVIDIPSMLASSNTTADDAEIGFFDTYPNNNNTSFNGAWSIYPYFNSGNIIISDIERGLFVVRQTNTLSTNDVTQNENFTIFPNPSFNNPTIKAKSNTLINSIELYNVLGQKISSIDNIGKNEFVLQTEHYTNGLYFVKINSLITKKIILK
ncbi:choice-of-anchor B family protein [Lacinutrix iliipiscaria]|uniref:Choice-of-anchor B family protein n=1 Tax=Lacinutrix iliipiscaria TaxID=1230532 RepID=A0ABW5WLM0_9FLAO